MEPGTFAAEPIAHLGVAFGFAIAKEIKGLSLIRHGCATLVRSYGASLRKRLT
jgi:hypothetical protein